MWTGPACVAIGLICNFLKKGLNCKKEKKIGTVLKIKRIGLFLKLKLGAFAIKKMKFRLICNLNKKDLFAKR